MYVDVDAAQETALAQCTPYHIDSECSKSIRPVVTQVGLNQVFVHTASVLSVEAIDCYLRLTAVLSVGFSRKPVSETAYRLQKGWLVWLSYCLLVNTECPDALVRLAVVCKQPTSRLLYMLHCFRDLLRDV